MELSVRDAKQAIEFNLDHKIKRSILMLGAPGIGKSEVVAQIAEERDMGFIDLRLLLYSETDLKGIPFPDEDGTTRWMPNKILPDIKRNGAMGIMLVDEITSAPKRVQAAAYQLIQDYRINEYVVPDGWFIVAAGNREDDDGVFVQMPSPLANRFEILYLTPNLDIWKHDYAYPRGVNPSVIAYLNFKPDALHTQDPGHNSMAFGSPRSWVAVSDILNTGASIKDRLTYLKVEGNIGDVEASSFKQFLKEQDSIISADDILSGRIKNPPTEKSLLCLIIASITSKLASLKHTTKISPEDEERLSNACRFYLKMNVEMLALGLRDLISINPSLLKKFFKVSFDTPEMLTFLKDNSYLFDT